MVKDVRILEYPMMQLDLQQNKLKGRLHQRDLLFKTAGIVKVNLQENQIDHLILLQKSESRVNLSEVKLNLTTNSIACDCFLYELRENRESRISVEVGECANNKEMGASLACPIECSDIMPDEFFKKCHCSYVPANHSAVVDCAARDRGVPSTGEKAENVAEKIETINVILRKNNLTQVCGDGKVGQMNQIQTVCKNV